MFQKTTSSKKVRYKSNKRKDDFFKDLKGRVDNYFVQNNLSKHANAHMIAKTIIAFVAWIFVYALFITNTFTGTLAVWCLYCVLGFINIFIAFVVVHDACHNAYSKKRKINSKKRLFM